MEALNRSTRMTSKERVLATFARSEPDRVPISYSGNPGINARMIAHFGLAEGDHTGLNEVLGVDFRGVGAGYVGEHLHEQVPDRQVDPLWGWRTRHVEHSAGSYWDYCDFPLRDADEEMVAAWSMPSADDFDYSHIAAACEANAEYGVHVGGAGTACIMNTAGMLRSMDQMFIDLALDDPAGLLLIDRMLEVQLEKTRRELEAANGAVDFMWMGEDLGTQRGPLISMETFHKHIAPRHKPFFDLARAHGIHTVLHTCGSSSWSYPDYIEMGLTVADTLQPEAVDMSPAYLKQTFGDRLAFNGCISTAGELAFGTVSDVKRVVGETLEIMMPGGGYCLSPTHMIQDNTPTENVVAMYETAHDLGRY